MKSTTSASIPMPPLKAAVYLSDRYITGRFLPDKAIDLLDEAGAKARIAMMHQPQDITKFETEIEEVRLAKEEAIGKQEYEKAAKLRDKEKTLRDAPGTKSAPSGKATKMSIK